MFNTTTDSILSVFTKTIAKLDRLNDAKVAEAGEALNEIGRLYTKKEAAFAEAAKAKKAADKLRTFFD